MCYNADEFCRGEMEMSLTQKEIAARAGVSCATVSRVLNAPEKVRPQLANLVYKTMQEMGFEISGSEIRQVQQAYNVLVVVSDMSYSLYSSFLVGISQMCNAHGLNLVVCNSGRDLFVEQRAIDMACRGGYVGIIFVTAENTQPYRDMVRQIRIPVVFLNRKIEGTEHDSVLLSHFETACLAVRRLLEAGHRHIAMLSTTEESINTRSEKAGYIDTLLHSGLVTYPQAESSIFYHPNSYEGGQEFAGRFLEERMKYDAVYVISSEQAVGLIDGFLQRLGSLPPKLTLMILNRISTMPNYLPNVIIMEQPVLEMGRKAVDVLLERAAQPERERMDILYNVTVNDQREG